MKVLNAQELRSIEQFFQLNQASLLKAMKQYLKSKYDKVICTNEYVMAIGDIPIALVAHLDTVFTGLPANIYYDRVKNVMWSSEGLGADDRAGVYSIVQILKSGLRPSVIFTTDEEVGGKGASAIIRDFPQPPMSLKYIIELDRHGSNDCVFYQCDNQEFEEYVETFGFVTNYGSFSDISFICPGWRIAGVNLSIGYDNEHSYSETLHIGQMYSTINKVKNMLKKADEAKTFEYIDLITQKWYKYIHPVDEDCYGWDPSYGISKKDWRHFIEPQSKCHDCGNWDYDYNLFPTKGDDGETIFLCCDCISNRQDIHWCSICGEPFIDATIPHRGDSKCKDCREVKKNERRNDKAD